MREKEKELAGCVRLGGVGGRQKEVKAGRKDVGKVEEGAEFSELEEGTRRHAVRAREKTTGQSVWYDWEEESNCLCVFAPLFSPRNVSWQRCEAS